MDSILDLCLLMRTLNQKYLDGELLEPPRYKNPSIYISRMHVLPGAIKSIDIDFKFDFRAYGRGKKG